MITKTLLSLKPKNLVTHPKNMRRFYPAEQVREMANSIAAAGGVLQPLIVIESEEKNSHKYIVVDGNMRLTAARLLEDKCPPLECKVVDRTEAEQLLSMVIANQVRYDVDAVSEGLHYKALQDEGLSVREISKRTGVYEIRIYGRLLLSKLEEPVQKLIAEGKLPHDERVARALLTLKPATRRKLAERLAQNPNTKISTILTACERLAPKDESAKKSKRPAAELSGALHGKGSTAPSAIREAARKACQSCNQYEGKLTKTAEPAWALVVHGADKTCEVCPLRDMQNICGSCPAVQLLKRLIDRG